MHRTGHRRLSIVAAVSTAIFTVAVLGAGSATAQPASPVRRGAHRVVAIIRTSYPIADLSLDPAAHTLYTTVGDEDQLLVIDTRMRRVTRVVGMPCAPSTVRVDVSTHRVFVGCGRTLRVMSQGLGRQLAVRRIGEGAVVGAIDPATHRVYVTSTEPNRLTSVDSRTYRMVSRRALDDAPAAVAVDPGRHSVYVTEGSATPPSSLIAFDAVTGRVLSRTPIGLPYAVAVDQRTDAVYVIGSNRTVAVVSAARHRVVRRITVPRAAVGLAFDDAHQVLYAESDPDNDRVRTISVIDAPTSRLIARILGPRSPSGMVVDPAADLLYVGSLSAGTITIEHVTP